MIARGSALAVLALLGGCAGPAGPCSIPAEQPALPGTDGCGATALERYRSVLPSAPVKAAIASAAGDRRIRYIAPGDAVTQDYNPSRLNVEIGEDGRIKRFHCG